MYEDDDRKKVLFEFSDPKWKPKPTVTAEDVLREVEGGKSKKSDENSDSGKPEKPSDP